jgi:3-deoxy-manno-octulosonate cytidylyltransferase (CMP-KDO synthetase)
MYQDVAIIIPARLGSTRLKEKAIQLIGDMTMIEHTYRKALLLGIEHLYVATDAKQIADVIEGIGGHVIMTDESCPSGSDRIYEALGQIKSKEQIKYVINLQGDLPLIDHAIIIDIIAKLKNTDADIVTAVSEISEDKAAMPSNVKVVVSDKDKALYFSRSMIPYNAKEYWYHIGIYGYSLDALERFVKLKPSRLENIEKLEQLRALENNMDIYVCYSDDIPISVDTQEDLDEVRKIFASTKSLI